jgi:polyhydroxybutyrate depolymerase
LLRSLLLLASSLLLAAALPSTTISSVGRRWTFYTAGSPAAGATAPVPLVVVLHGAGGSGGGFLDRSGWADKARDEGFVAVAPSGQSLHPDEPTDFLANPRVWNIGVGLWGDDRLKIDDQMFILDLLAEVQRTHNIDARRIYATGHSNGGIFCFKLAMAYPERWAAIAPVAASLPALTGSLRRTVPTYAVFGSEDKIVPVQGGEIDTPWGHRSARPVPEMLSRWAQALGYPGTIDAYNEDAVQRTERYGPDFQVTYLKEHGHNYPSAFQPLVDPRFGPVRTDFPLNDRIWDFFKQRQLPGGESP